jgi:predicted GNAT superfamily acetyltransferase
MMLPKNLVPTQNGNAWKYIYENIFVTQFFKGYQVFECSRGLSI